MHGSTLLLSDHFDLYYDTDSSEQCVGGIYYDPPNLQVRKLRSGFAEIM